MDHNIKYTPLGNQNRFHFQVSWEYKDFWQLSVGFPNLSANQSQRLYYTCRTPKHLLHFSHIIHTHNTSQRADIKLHSCVEENWSLSQATEMSVAKLFHSWTFSLLVETIHFALFSSAMFFHRIIFPGTRSPQTMKNQHTVKIHWPGWCLVLGKYKHLYKSRFVHLLW